MTQPNDPDTLKIPAYLRKKTIVSQAKQKLILTALDRKEAGLSHTSQKALAPVKISRTKDLSTTPRSFNSKPSASISPQKFQNIGTITHYLEKIGVAIIQLSTKLKQGDLILIEGDGYFFLQSVEEMQINRQPVKKAKAGDDIGLKVAFQTKTGTFVYKP